MDHGFIVAAAQNGFFFPLFPPNSSSGYVIALCEVGPLVLEPSGIIVSTTAPGARCVRGKYGSVGNASWIGHSMKEFHQIMSDRAARLRRRNGRLCEILSRSMSSLVPRPSRGGERKAWYTLHAHAPRFLYILP